jgi:hypothetical protein
MGGSKNILDKMTKFDLNKITERFEHLMNCTTEVDLENARFSTEERKRRGVNIHRFGIFHSEKTDFPDKMLAFNYLSERFIKTEAWYIIMQHLVSYFRQKEEPATRKEACFLLSRILMRLIVKDLRKKKIKKKIWGPLPLEEKLKVCDETLTYYWANAEEAGIIEQITSTSKSGKPIALYKLKDSLDLELFPLIEYTEFQEFPRIIKPKDWIMEETDDNKVKIYQGLTNFDAHFVREKETHTGYTYVNKKLVEVVNYLQTQEWYIDLPIKNEDILNWEYNQYDLKDIEDIHQKNASLALVNYTLKNDKSIYYIWTIDFRGRLYPLALWGFSPTSSKHLIRRFIRSSVPCIYNNTYHNAMLIYVALIMKNIEKDVLSNETLRRKLSISHIYKDVYDKKYSYKDLKNIGKKILETTTKMDELTYDIYIFNRFKDCFETKTAYNYMGQIDATASGAQIAAILMNDEDLARAVNLCAPEESDITESSYIQKDLYLIILNESLESFNIFPEIKDILDRKLIKSLIMPLIYKKTEYTSRQDVMTSIIDLNSLKQIKKEEEKVQKELASYIKNKVLIYISDEILKEYLEESYPDKDWRKEKGSTPKDRYEELAKKLLTIFIKKEVNKEMVWDWEKIRNNLTNQEIKDFNEYFKIKKNLAAKLITAHVRKVTFEMYPKLKEFLEVFDDKEFYSKYPFSTEFLDFENTYMKYNQIRLKLKINDKEKKYSFKDPSDTKKDEKKSLSSSAANYVHGIDANIIQKIIRKFKEKNIQGFWPNHDCLKFRLEDLEIVTKVVKEAYVEIQDFARKHEFWKKYHTNGSFKISGRHMMRIE